MELSRKDRWVLSNQYRILEALYPDEADGFRQTREALESGYALHYDPQHIYEDELSVDQCREVLDILDMHRALHFSFRNLQDTQGIDKRNVEFDGFDGNNETSYLGYARYYWGLDGGEQRFKELHGSGDDFNSHSPVLDIYRRMLAVWKGKLKRSHELTKDQIQQILKERVHPSNRK